jgi:hypothetical protein
MKFLNKTKQNKTKQNKTYNFVDAYHFSIY